MGKTVASSHGYCEFAKRMRLFCCRRIASFRGVGYEARGENISLFHAESKSSSVAAVCKTDTDVRMNWTS